MMVEARIELVPDLDMQREPCVIVILGRESSMVNVVLSALEAEASLSSGYYNIKRSR